MDPLIIIVLVVTSAAQVTACNLSQTNETHQCYGAVGESLSLHLAEGSNGDIILKKGNTRIFKINRANQRRTFHNDYLNRLEFFNETLLFNGAIKNDSGCYNIEIFNSEGTLQHIVNMQLVIQAPVSDPLLSYFCLPNGDYLVTCISVGDDLQFSWTLNSQILTKSVTYNVVKLKHNDNRDLSCIVQNKVSSLNSTIDLPACQDVSSKLPFAVAILAVIMGAVTLSVLLAMFNHLYQKRRFKNDTSESTNIEDVVYTDVKICKQTKKQAAMVEYGQIKNPRCGRDQTDVFYKHM